MRQLRCQHGHQFDVASTADQRVVCPLCGSVTTLKADMHTPAPGPHDRTIISRESVPVESHSSSAPTHFSGQTFITEAPQALDLTVDFPAPPEESPAPVENVANRTIIVAAAELEADEFERSVPAAPTPDTDRLSSPPPVADVAQSLSVDVRPVPTDSVPVVAPSGEIRAASKSSVGLRSTVPMQTEIELTEPPNLPGYKVVNELGRAIEGREEQVCRYFEESLSVAERNEVLNLLRDLGYMQTEIITVDPHQFLGIEVNPRAAAIADLVTSRGWSGCVCC